MKSFKVLLSAILIFAMLVMPSLATDVVPSIERKDSVVLVDYTLEEIDTPCRTVLIIPYGKIHFDEFINANHLQIQESSADEIEDEIRLSLQEALAELKNALIHHLVRGFEDVWEKTTGGAPVENAIVDELFEVVLICSEKEDMMTDEKISVSFTVDGIDADDLFVVVHKPTGSDEWIVEEHEIDENGVITIHPDKLSPFAIIKDSGAAPVATVTSPQTGVTEYTAAAILIAGILAGISIVCVKKSRHISVQ